VQIIGTKRLVVALASALALTAGSAAHAATFSTTVVSGDNVTEPGIDVGPDNAIYVNGPTGLLSNLPGSPSNLYRSDDAGATWKLTPYSLRANLPGGGDFDISIDPKTNTLYSTDLWLGSATVGKSTDDGNSWVANPLQGVVIQDRQWVATSGGGVVYHATHQIPAGLIVSKSLPPADGIVYPLSTVAATPLDQTGCVCPPGNLIAEGSGAMAGLTDKVGLIYATSSGGVNFARSTNGATTFTSTTVSPASSAATNGNFPVVANGGGGHLFAVWQEVAGNSSTVHFASSADWGATWSAPRALVSSGTSVFPWVAAKGSKVSVSLYNTAASGTPDNVPAGAQWFETYLQSTDGGATFSAPTTVDQTPAKTGPICTEGINCSSGRELGDFQSLTLDNAGAADLAYVHSFDGTDTEIRFAHQTG
jgi:hypothetical protein